MAILPIRLDRLLKWENVTNPDGTPNQAFQAKWQRVMENIEESVNAVIDAQNAADAANAAAVVATTAAATANTAATNAANAAEATASETSIVNSFVKGFSGASPLEADNAGNVTVKSHTRQYGDTVLNPDIVITGTVLATAAAAASIVRVYYDDATRADGTPTFAFTVDPAASPIQGGDRHVIGAVEIPAAGTSDGGFVRQPGYTGIEP